VKTKTSGQFWAFCSFSSWCWVGMGQTDRRTDGRTEKQTYIITDAAS